MTDTCRYCGDKPRQDCYAKEGEACEYPKYQKGALLAENARLRSQLAEDAADHNRCMEVMGAENARLRVALKPFADAVYNDNGDMTITPCDMDAYRKAYFVCRELEGKIGRSAGSRR